MALVDLSGPAIRPGESLSDPLDCRGGTILRVREIGGRPGGDRPFGSYPIRQRRRYRATALRASARLKPATNAAGSGNVLSGVVAVDAA